MKALYRKYRPTRLQDVVGQDQVIKPLSAAVKTGNISHAYLFTGPRGCGKTSVARIFAHEINNFKYELEDSYIDIIEIDAASNTGVDNIRELREKAMIAPSEGKYKVYIIDEVHMLSKAAFNALLKTLEEPPEHVVFIMATTDAYKVPITITSRSQNYIFELAAPDVMKKHLKNIAKIEKINIADDALDLIVHRGGGSFRDSISLLDQISTLNTEKITREDLISALGLPDDLKLDQLLEAYEAGDTAAISDALKSLLNSGTKAEIVAEEIIGKIVTAPRPGTLKLLEKLPEVGNPFPEAKLLLAFIGDSATTPVMSPLRVPPLAQPTPIAPDAAPASNTSGLPAATTPVKPTAEPLAPVPPTAKSAVKPTSDPQKSPETPLESPETPETPKVAPAEAFDWEAYKTAVKDVNGLLASTLETAAFGVSGSVISVFPERKIHKTILSSTNNLNLLIKHLPTGYTLEIRNPGENLQNDEKLSQISDIMGNIQEVKSNGVPF